MPYRRVFEQIVKTTRMPCMFRQTQTVAWTELLRTPKAPNIPENVRKAILTVIFNACCSACFPFKTLYVGFTLFRFEKMLLPLPSKYIDFETN